MAHRKTDAQVNPPADSGGQAAVSKSYGVLLLSGGLDSTTLASYALRAGYDVLALTVTYGQTHERELESARSVAAALRLRHETIDLSFFKNIAWYSALTHPDRLPIPREKPSDPSQAIPVTYVPLRNTLLMALAAACAESMALNAIEREAVPAEQVEAVIFIGANAIDYSGYPDCRPEYYDSLRETLRLGSKLGIQYGRPLRIEAPFLGKNKADIIRLALELDAPLEYSWSCYVGGTVPCGTCDSCRIRADGFAEAGVPDPALAHR